MKKQFFVIITMVLCIGLNTNVNAQKKSETFRTVTESFNTNMETYESSFFSDFFELTKTGKEMLDSSIIINDLQQKMFEAFITELGNWKTFSLEEKGDKPFKYKHKKCKGYSEEVEEFERQINLLIQDYKNNRLKWTKTDLSKKQSMEIMLKYITPITAKFAKRIKSVQDKVKNL